MQILKEIMTKEELKTICTVCFDDEMVTAVVDLGSDQLGIDAELHADIEQMFLQQGARQEDLWGINLYFDEEGEDFIEYDSLINIRPRQNNMGRGVYDEMTRKKIAEVVRKWIV